MRQMKDSGIAWIGQIPQDLEVIKNHYLVTYVKGKNPNDLNSEGIGFPYIGASDLDSNNYSIYTTDSLLPSVDSNDVLILWDGARAGLVGIGKIGKLSSTVVKLQFVEKINSRYFYWYLLGMSSFITSCVNGTTIPHMSRKYIDDICFITFPLSEQQAIADKLDKVCGEIDKVIAKTKVVVEEYKKLKQAIITEAVTGKKQCVMRNSQCGIKEKWAEIKLKWVVKSPLKYGASEEGVPYVDDLPRYIRITDITLDGNLKDENKKSLPFDKANDYLLKDGTILFARSGATVGKSFLYSSDMGIAAFAGYLIAAEIDNTKAYSKYVFYCVNSSLYWEWCKSIFSQATIQNIGADKYREVPVFLPPLPEQQAIVAYLDSKCGAIDELIAKKQQLIAEMENYKKSVIYECVTGKKEVG